MSVFENIDLTIVFFTDIMRRRPTNRRIRVHFTLAFAFCAVTIDDLNFAHVTAWKTKFQAKSSNLVVSA